MGSLAPHVVSSTGGGGLKIEEKYATADAPYGELLKRNLQGADTFLSHSFHFHEITTHSKKRQYISSFSGEIICIVNS